MDLTDILPILTLLFEHKWLGAAVVLIALVRKLLGPSSTLLPTISPEARNVLMGALSLVGGAIAAIDAGKGLGIAIFGALVSGIAGGLLDAVVTLFFAQSAAPAWIKIPLRIIDDVAKAEAERPQDPPAPPPAGPQKAIDIKPLANEIEPELNASRRLAATFRRILGTVARMAALAVVAGIVSLCAASAVGCAWWQTHEQAVVPAAQTIEECVAPKAIAGESFAQIAIECGVSEIELLKALLASTDRAVNASRAFGQAIAMAKLGAAYAADMWSP